MIAIACDHAAVRLKNEITAYLAKLGFACRDFGCDGKASVDYPDYAAAVCQAVQSGECEKGILICGTGIGMSMAANKFKGIRCAHCADSLSASLTRLHNDANVLAIGARVIGDELAFEIVRTFLQTPFSGDERHVRRINKISAIEEAQK
ncbi:MAG: ribose 5-phosphate isomerase B [Clostridiales bacterium]|nr:ribose 5-phosphate isomerase B [Clostridiales bacterium]